MMTQTQMYKDPNKRFYELFSDFEGMLNGQKDTELHQYRRKAAKKLLELDFPTTRVEDWKYTSVARIIQQEYALGPKPNVDSLSSNLNQSLIPDSLNLQFVNGYWINREAIQAQLPAGLKILTLAEAFDQKEMQTIAESALQFGLQDNNDVFLQLNQAFARDSVLITVEDNVTIDKMVSLSYTFTQSSKSLIAGPQVFCMLGKASGLKLLEHFYGENPGFFIVQNRFNIGSEARLMHYKLQELGSEDFLIYNNIADQHSNSTYTHFNIDLGGRIVRNNISAIHRGSNLVSNLFGVFPGSGEQHVDTQSLIDHAMPYCESHELYRQVLKDKSRGVFNGKVMVRQDAQKTNAYQQNDTLLVSDTARMDSKPQLEIFADDVRCSHGATIGQLDENAIFYLKSRGLSDSEARFLLEWAFVNEVLEKIEQEEVREFLSERVRSKVLSKEQF